MAVAAVREVEVVMSRMVYQEVVLLVTEGMDEFVKGKSVPGTSSMTWIIRLIPRGELRWSNEGVERRVSCRG